MLSSIKIGLSIWTSAILYSILSVGHYIQEVRLLNEASQFRTYLCRQQASSLSGDVVTTICDPLSSLLFLIAPLIIILLTLVASISATQPSKNMIIETVLK